MDYKLEQILYDPIEENIEDNFILKMNVLKDLPIEMQIDKFNFYSTYDNLYNYYINNNHIISRLPKEFYELYVMEKSFRCINILNTRDLNEDIRNNVELIN